jgi:very-short-patch-repair endonuclease
MNRTGNARRLRREQTKEEKQLWRALRAGRFAGFKFRRQHPLGKYYLDFFCPAAQLAVELDGSQHGMPERILHDETRAKFLSNRGVMVLRYWNRNWRHNRAGILLEIWLAVQQRTGKTKLERKVENHRFVPPDPAQLMPKPPKPA